MAEHPEPHDTPIAVFTDVTGQRAEMADVVELALTHLLGLNKYVLLSIAGPCDHGIASVELFSRGLDHDALGQLLIDLTSAHAAHRLDKEKE